MDDTTRSIIRNVKGPGKFLRSLISPSTCIPLPSFNRAGTVLSRKGEWRLIVRGRWSIVREDDILVLLESEREARRLR